MSSSVPQPVLPSPEQLSLGQQVAQLVVVRASGHLFDHQRQYPQWEADSASLARALELGVGGVILLGGSAAEVGVRSQQLQSQADIPLLLAADIEEGVGQRFAGATWFPPPMALGAIFQRDPEQAQAYAQAFGAATAAEAVAIGLNWLLAPVVDVNNNPANPVINVRAFGDAPEVVGPLAQAFIRGAQSQPVLTTAKHFPGHGDTAVDSHLQLPTLDHDRPRLEQLEWMPFRDAIATGVDAVMTAHLRVSALDPRHPATLSPPVLGALRQSLGFDGLIVTDALVMGAITDTYGPYEAAVMAVEAGADVLLMPADVEGTLAALTEAVAVGRLSPERILASVERLWRAKQKTAALIAVPESCHAWEHVPPPPVRLELLSPEASPAARATAAAVLKDSMTVQGCLSPAPAGAENRVLVDDILGCRFLPPTAAALTLPGYCLRLMDGHGCHQLPAAAPPPTLLQLFIRGNPFRSATALTELADAWLQALVAAEQLQGLVVYGSPYVLEQLQPRLPASVPYGFTYGQMPEAQALLLGALGLQSATAGGFTD